MTVTADYEKLTPLEVIDMFIDQAGPEWVVQACTLAAVRGLRASNTDGAHEVARSSDPGQSSNRVQSKQSSKTRLTATNPVGMSILAMFQASGVVVSIQDILSAHSDNKASYVRWAVNDLARSGKLKRLDRSNFVRSE